MLQQFTWGQFLLASFMLSFLWYGFVLLIFYRKEMLGFFTGGGLGESLPHRWENEVDVLGEKSLSEESLDEAEDLMGKSAVTQGLEVLPIGELSFSANEGVRYEQVGLVADVIQELKIIFSSLETNAGSKLDFFRMLEKVKEDYGKIGAHPNVRAINAFIVEHVPFHLTVDELENLWY